MAITQNDNGLAVRLNVPFNTITQSSGQSSIGSGSSAFVIISSVAGQRMLQIGTPATTGTINWGLTFDMPTVPYQIGNTGNNVARGFQMTDVTLTMAISSGSVNASNNCSTLVLTAFTTGPMTDGASISSAIAYGGSSSQWTFNEGSSVGSSMGQLHSAASTIQVLQFVPGAGLNTFLNSDNQQVWFQLTFNSGSTNFQMNVYDLAIHGKWLAV